MMKINLIWVALDLPRRLHVELMLWLIHNVDIHIKQPTDTAKYTTAVAFHWHLRAPLVTIAAWKNNHIHYDVWDEIAHPFPNFNGATV